MAYCDELRARREPELAHDVRAVRLGGARRDPEDPRDLRVRVAQREQAGHLPFALGQAVWAPRDAGDARAASRRAPSAACTYCWPAATARTAPRAPCRPPPSGRSRSRRAANAPAPTPARRASRARGCAPAAQPAAPRACGRSHRRSASAGPSRSRRAGGGAPRRRRGRRSRPRRRRARRASASSTWRSAERTTAWSSTSSTLRASSGLATRQAYPAVRRRPRRCEPGASTVPTVSAPRARCTVRAQRHRPRSSRSSTGWPRRGRRTP